MPHGFSVLPGILIRVYVHYPIELSIEVNRGLTAVRQIRPNHNGARSFEFDSDFRTMRSAEFRLVLNAPVTLPEPAGVVDIYTLNGRSVIVPDLQFGRLRLLRGDRQS